MLVKNNFQKKVENASVRIAGTKAIPNNIVLRNLFGCKEIFTTSSLSSGLFLEGGNSSKSMKSFIHPLFEVLYGASDLAKSIISLILSLTTLGLAI